MMKWPGSPETGSARSVYRCAAQEGRLGLPHARRASVLGPGLAHRPTLGPERSGAVVKFNPLLFQVGELRPREGKQSSPVTEKVSDRQGTQTHCTAWGLASLLLFHSCPPVLPSHSSLANLSQVPPGASPMPSALNSVPWNLRLPGARSVPLGSHARSCLLLLTRPVPATILGHLHSSRCLRCSPCQ